MILLGFSRWVSFKVFDEISCKNFNFNLANSGKHTNGCQFFITCTKCDFLDQKHVVFGKVIEDGMLIVRKVENIPTDGSNKPRVPVVIVQCGEM